MGLILRISGIKQLLTKHLPFDRLRSPCLTNVLPNATCKPWRQPALERNKISTLVVLRVYEIKKSRHNDAGDAPVWVEMHNPFLTTFKSPSVEMTCLLNKQIR